MSRPLIGGGCCGSTVGAEAPMVEGLRSSPPAWDLEPPSSPRLPSGPAERLDRSVARTDRETPSAAPGSPTGWDPGGLSDHGQGQLRGDLPGGEPPQSRRRKRQPTTVMTPEPATRVGEGGPCFRLRRPNLRGDARQPSPRGGPPRVGEQRAARRLPPPSPRRRQGPYPIGNHHRDADEIRQPATPAEVSVTPESAGSRPSNPSSPPAACPQPAGPRLARGEGLQDDPRSP